MRHRLPPGLKRRQYKTRGGYKRTLYYPCFVIWKRKPDGSPDRRQFSPGIEDFDAAVSELSRLKELNRLGFDFNSALPGRPPGMTLFPWIEKLLELKADKPIVLRHASSVLRLKAFFGDCSLDEILHSRMLEYRKHRSAGKKPAAVATINRELACLRSVLRLAHEDGLLKKLPSIPMEKEFNERTRTATETEYVRILGLLSPEWRDIVSVLWETGFRVGEVLLMTPADLDYVNAAIDMSRIRKKHGIKRILPLSPRAWEILSRRAVGKNSSSRIFQVDRSGVRRAFARACQALGIRDLWLHDLRATFATMKERQGCARKIIQEYTGHRTEFAFKRYSRPTMDDLKVFVGNVDPIKQTTERRLTLVRPAAAGSRVEGG